MQVSAHMVALERIPVLHNKVLMARSPSRQTHITDLLLQVVQPQLEVRMVFHKGAVAKVKLRSELFVVRQKLYIQHVLPGNVDIMENLVWWSTNRLVLDFEDVARYLPN